MLGLTAPCRHFFSCRAARASASRAPTDTACAGASGPSRRRSSSVSPAGARMYREGRGGTVPRRGPLCTKRERRVPLSGRAFAILHDVRRRSDGTGLVFRSPRGKPLSNMTLSKLIKELGIVAVPHGFRSSFRDCAAERTNTPREVVEATLAHTVRNPTEGTPRRPFLIVTMWPSDRSSASTYFKCPLWELVHKPDGHHSRRQPLHALGQSLARSKEAQHPKNAGSQAEPHREDRAPEQSRPPMTSQVPHPCLGCYGPACVTEFLAR